MHRTLSGTCSMKEDVKCMNFVCNADYERNQNVESLSCTTSGVWNHNLSTFCVGKSNKAVSLDHTSMAVPTI